MRMIELSPQGLELTQIIPGMMRLDTWGMRGQALLDWIKQVMGMGLTSFDHADIYGGYGNEALFGDALRIEPSLRHQMQLVTKGGIQLMHPNRPDIVVNHYNTTAEHLIRSAEQSLLNLHTDYLDLYLVHRPDMLMHPSEIAEAFYQLRNSGKVRHFGVSNFTPSQFTLLEAYLDFPLVTNQVEFSVLHLDPLYDGTFDQALLSPYAPMIWSPLAGGRLFGTTDDPQAQRVVAVLEEVAREVEARDIDSVALAWILQHPSNPTIITGSGKIERLQSALNATELTLSRQQWFRILVASLGHNVP